MVHNPHAIGMHYTDTRALPIVKSKGSVGIRSTCPDNRPLREGENPVRDYYATLPVVMGYRIPAITKVFTVAISDDYGIPRKSFKVKYLVVDDEGFPLGRFPLNRSTAERWAKQLTNKHKR